MFDKEDKIRWDELALSLQDKLEKMSKRGEEYYNTHIKDVYNKISNNTTAISKESNERKQADKNLQSNIDKVKSDLATETKNRQSAESTIQSNINTLKKDTTANLSALNGKITNATSKIDGKQFVKSKDATNNIELKYEKKGSDTAASLHAYVDGQDIPLSSASGGGGGLGALPDYTKTKSFIEMVNYTHRATSFIAPTDGMITGGLVSVNTDTDYLAHYHYSTKLTINDCPFPSNACVCDSSQLNRETGSITYYGAAFVRKGDVISIKEYTESGQVDRTYYLYLNNGSLDYVGKSYYFTPLTRNLTDDRSEKLVKCIAGFGLPEYTKKQVLLAYDSQTNSSNDMYVVMPEDGYIYCIYDHGKYYNTPYGADITVEGMENTLESGTVVPVSQGSKIHVTIDRGYRVRATIYFIPIKHTGEATAPDYTDMREMMNESNWSSSKTIPMPSDGYVQIITNLDDVLSVKINNHTTTFAGPSSPLYPVAAGDYVTYNYTGGTFKIIYIPLKGGAIYRPDVVVPDLNRPIADNASIKYAITSAPSQSQSGFEHLVTITFKKPCIYYVVCDNQHMNITNIGGGYYTSDTPVYCSTPNDLAVNWRFYNHTSRITVKVYCFEPYSIQYNG